MKLVAVKEFSYASKRLMRGQSFDASSSDARILKAIGKAKDAPAGNGVAHDEPVAADDVPFEIDAPTIAPAPVFDVPRDLVYPTRELAPEPAPVAAADVSPAVRIRRKYTRRNLTPQR